MRMPKPRAAWALPDFVWGSATTRMSSAFVTRSRTTNPASTASACARSRVIGSPQRRPSARLKQTVLSALLLTRFLGPIRLEPVPVEVGRPYYRALTAIDTLALIETPPEPDSPDGGSTSLRSWRWGESNPRPQATDQGFSGRSRRWVSPRGSRRRRTSRPARVRCPAAAPGRSHRREPAHDARPREAGTPGRTATQLVRQRARTQCWRLCWCHLFSDACGDVGPLPLRGTRPGRSRCTPYSVVEPV